MKYLHIVSLDPKTLAPVTRATCSIAKGDAAATCSGDETLVAELRLGVFHPGLARSVTPEDGELFLRTVPLEYRHPSLFATEIFEGETVAPYALPPEKKIGTDAAQ